MGKKLLKKKNHFKKKRIIIEQDRDYFNLKRSDKIKSLKHLRPKKPIVEQVAENLSSDDEDIDYKQLLEKKINDFLAAKNKDIKNNKIRKKWNYNKPVRSSLKTMNPHYSKEEKQKKLGELVINLKHKIDKEIIVDYLNGYEVPNSVYWPSLNNLMYLCKSNSFEPNEKSDKYIQELVNNKYFMFYAYVIYQVEDKNKNVTYYHYLNMKFWKQPTLTTNNLKEYELLDIKEKKEIVRIITGCRGACNTYSKLYTFKNYDKYYFQKKIVKKIKELNYYIYDYNDKYHTKIIPLNKKNVVIKNTEGITGSDLKSVDDINCDNFI